METPNKSQCIERMIKALVVSQTKRKKKKKKYKNIKIHVYRLFNCESNITIVANLSVIHQIFLQAILIYLVIRKRIS